MVGERTVPVQDVASYRAERLERLNRVRELIARLPAKEGAAKNSEWKARDHPEIGMVVVTFGPPDGRRQSWSFTYGELDRQFEDPEGEPERLIENRCKVKFPKPKSPKG